MLAAIVLAAVAFDGDGRSGGVYRPRLSGGRGWDNVVAVVEGESFGHIVANDCLLVVFVADYIDFVFVEGVGDGRSYPLLLTVVGEDGGRGPFQLNLAGKDVEVAFLGVEAEIASLFVDDDNCGSAFINVVHIVDLVLARGDGLTALHDSDRGLVFLAVIDVFVAFYRDGQVACGGGNLPILGGDARELVVVVVDALDDGSVVARLCGLIACAGGSYFVIVHDVAECYRYALLGAVVCEDGGR